MLKLISWFLFQLSAQVSVRQNLVPIEHDSPLSSPPSPARLSHSPLTFRSVCVTGSSAQMSNVPKAASTMELHQPPKKMGKSVRSFIPHCLCLSLAGYFQKCLCPASPPSNLSTLLLCEINFGEQRSRGGRPLRSLLLQSVYCHGD